MGILFRCQRIAQTIAKKVQGDEAVLSGLAQHQQKLERQRSPLARPDLLIIDQMGYILPPASRAVGRTSLSRGYNQIPVAAPESQRHLMPDKPVAYAWALDQRTILRLLACVNDAADAFSSRVRCQDEGRWKDEC